MDSRKYPPKAMVGSEMKANATNQRVASLTF